MGSFRAHVLTGILAFGVAGCATMQDKAAAYRQNTPAIRPDLVTHYTQDQERIVAALTTLAVGNGGTLPDMTSGQADWSPLVHAGLLYVEARCERYLDALFWVNRLREGTSRQIGYTGAAATAALALVEASKELIGLTPLGFTLLDQTVNNLGKGLLYDLHPTVVKQIVYKQQTEYKKLVARTRYTNRVAALEAVYGYVSICLPTSIETQVNEAIGRAEFKPAPAAAGAAGAVGAGGAAAGAVTPATTGGAGQAAAAAGGEPADNSVPVLEQVQRPE